VRRATSSAWRRNGAGKTTTLKTISVFSGPSAGRIVFGGGHRGPEAQDISAVGIDPLSEGRRSSRIFTVQRTWPWGPMCAGTPPRWRRTLERVLAQFPRPRRAPAPGGRGTLSGGEQQMLAIGGR